jgi:hypothetical protein
MEEAVVMASEHTKDRSGKAAGSPGLTSKDLPPVGLRRWIPRRKAQLVDAVHQGLIDRDEALRLYGLSDDEFGNWERLFTRHGLRGLYVTRSQRYRDAAKQEARERWAHCKGLASSEDEPPDAES